VLAKQRAHDAQPAPAQASTSTTVVSPENQVIGANPDPAIRSRASVIGREQLLFRPRPLWVEGRGLGSELFLQTNPH
jgi:hypothetical protein